MEVVDQKALSGGQLNVILFIPYYGRWGRSVRERLGFERGRDLKS